MMNENKPYILVFGVSIYDIFGFASNNYKCRDSNPGKVRVSYGGVCRNIAENMARVGTNLKFISIVGDDDKGRCILQHAEALGIDIKDSLIVYGESTPTYMAIMNEYGEMVSAIVDLSITDKISEEFIDSKEDIITNSEYMVLGADNPRIMEYILTKYQGKTKFILDPVSSARVQKISYLIKYFYTIKPNRHEAEALCGFKIENTQDVRKAGKCLLDQGVKQVFISLDAEGIYYNNGQEEGIIKANHVSVVNVTGAGDSCVAGLGYGYMNGLSIVDMLKYSIAMSVITISHEETIHPNMNCDMVQTYIKNLDWTEIKFSSSSDGFDE